MTFSRPQCFFNLLLIVDIENDPAQMTRCTVIAVDNAAASANAVTAFMRSSHPILNIQVAPSFDRSLHGEFSALAILRFKQREKKTRNSQADRLKRRAGFVQRRTRSIFGLRGQDPKCRYRSRRYQATGIRHERSRRTVPHRFWSRSAASRSRAGSHAAKYGKSRQEPIKLSIGPVGGIAQARTPIQVDGPDKWLTGPFSWPTRVPSRRLACWGPRSAARTRPVEASKISWPCAKRCS